MSYDVSIYDLDGGEVLSVNYTRNTSMMWRTAGCDLRDFAEKPAETLAEALAPAVAEMEANPDTYRVFNASNGWGDYEGTLTFLKKILGAAQQYPNGKVHISS